MKKVVIHKAGSYERLKIEEHADLEPGPGEIVVAVEAAGVNYADVVVRMGLYASAKELVGWPITPGFEVAGRVHRLGAGVTDLQIGERVMAVTLFDGYATQLRVRREQVFAIPEALDTPRAAGFPAVFLTAWYALIELCRLRPGMNVLVHSAAGGVGGALVQIAKRSGCSVVGVVGGAHKIDAAKSHGANAVIDKSSEPLWPAVERHAPGGYDVVLDANGVETLGQSYRHLRASGRLVIYGFHTMMPKQGGRPNWPKLALDWLRTPRFNPLDLTNDNKSVLAFNLSYLFERLDIFHEGMTDLLAWASAGEIHAHAVEEIPFEAVAEAHRKIESGRTVGKLVLVMPNS
jgi:NADPH:quinone reductase-like Zn-dependent oxidoreductase